MADLYVLRHAKSSWDDPSLADVERPLAPRGRKAARLLGRHLSDEGIRPELVLCSPAVRAHETLARIGPALADVETLVEPGLYGASASDLIERLRAVPEDTSSVVVIGHNPALQNLIVRLARPGPLRDRANAKLPTGALATLELDGDWNALTDGGAELTDLLLPRELPGS
jgi:phosphohistidine phosphatase